MSGSHLHFITHYNNTVKYQKEILVLEAIIFVLLWITNSYIAVLCTFIVVPIFAGTWLISIIAEWLEKSKVAKSYFFFILGLAMIPSVLFIVFSTILGGVGEIFKD